jgi:hypothetical protein
MTPIFFFLNVGIRWYSAKGAEYSAETEYSVLAMVGNIRFCPKLKIPVSVDHYLQLRYMQSKICGAFLNVSVSQKIQID